MKRTCICGASIEIKHDDEQHSAIREFRAEHAKCLSLWHDSMRRKGGEIQNNMISDVPITNYYTKPPDLYSRFRDAIRDGKRVFFTQKAKRETLVQTTLEHLTDVNPRFTSLTVEGMLIEGIDIPVQPTQEWLDYYGQELTGECRKPKDGDVWVSPGDGSSDPMPHRDTDASRPDGRFGGRRWIVRERTKAEKLRDLGTAVERTFGDDGFEKWWNECGSRLIHDRAKVAAMIAWRAAQEAKK